MPTNADPRYRMYSPDLDVRMREVLHTLGQIDRAAEVELDEVANSALDPDWKQAIQAEIRAAYRQKRQPYVDLLDQLRQQQHRQSFAV